MHGQRIVYLISCGIALAALLGGGGLVLAYGFQPPGWLLRCEVAAFSALALVCGFTAALPPLLPWLRLRPVQGAVLVVLGVGAPYVPPQFIASALLLALGIRLVWKTACELADAERERRPAPAARDAARAEGIERQPAAAPARRVNHVPMVHPAGQRRPD